MLKVLKAEVSGNETIFTLNYGMGRASICYNLNFSFPNYSKVTLLTLITIVWKRKYDQNQDFNIDDQDSIKSFQNNTQVII